MLYPSVANVTATAGTGSIIPSEKCFKNIYYRCFLILPIINAAM